MSKYTIEVLEGLLARKCYAISDAEQIAIIDAMACLCGQGWTDIDELSVNEDNVTNDTIVVDKEGNKTLTYILYAAINRENYTHFMIVPTLSRGEI